MLYVGHILSDALVEVRNKKENYMFIGVMKCKQEQNA
jgi:hypothetical protein